MNEHEEREPKCGGLAHLGGKYKFTVLKNADLERCSAELRQAVGRAGDAIAALRHQEGRAVWPEYLVVNLDEPYAAEVIEILKRNGHWG